MPIGKSQLLMKCPARPHQNIDGFQNARGEIKILRLLCQSAGASHEHEYERKFIS